MHKRALLLLSALAAMALALSLSTAAMADDSGINVKLNGRSIRFNNPPVVIDNTTMVEVRPFAEAFGCDVKWSQNTQSVKLTTSRLGLVLKLDYEFMTVSDMTGRDDGDMEQIYLPVSPVVINGSTYVPLRAVAESLNAEVEWDSEENAILISKNGYEYGAAPSTRTYDSFGGSGHTFYFQNQADWELPGYGSGYCWTVSYAMVISDVTGELVTPADVAAINETHGGSGSYCCHWDIINSFDVEFVSALDEDSAYYGGRDSNSGGTVVLCDDEFEAIDALKEAIDRNPAGVMVRYADYPHTMVAVGYDGDTILFNDPMQTSRSYEDFSSKENVPFEETCVGKSGINIEDITFIQALAVK